MGDEIMSTREIVKIKAYMEQLEKTKNILKLEISGLSTMLSALNLTAERIGKGFGDEEIENVNAALDDSIKNLKEAKMKKL